VAALAEQELRRLVLLVQVVRPHRSCAVDALQIRSRRAEVLDLTGIGAMPDRGAVGRDVVSDELAEERPARGNVGVGGLVGGGVVQRSSWPTKGVERLLVDLERRQCVEQTLVAPPIDGASRPLRGETLVVGDHRRARQ
jgi:hypothetical protein